MKFSICLRDKSVIPHQMIVEVHYEHPEDAGSSEGNHDQTFIRFVRVVKALLPIRKSNIDVAINVSPGATTVVPRALLNLIIETRWPLMIISQ